MTGILTMLPAYLRTAVEMLFYSLLSVFVVRIYSRIPTMSNQLNNLLHRTQTQESTINKLSALLLATSNSIHSKPPLRPPKYPSTSSPPPTNPSPPTTTPSPPTTTPSPPISSSPENITRGHLSHSTTTPHHQHHQQHHHCNPLVMMGQQLVPDNSSLLDHFPMSVLHHLPHLHSRGGSGTSTSSIRMTATSLGEMVGGGLMYNPPDFVELSTSSSSPDPHQSFGIPLRFPPDSEQRHVIEEIGEDEEREYYSSPPPHPPPAPPAPPAPFAPHPLLQPTNPTTSSSELPDFLDDNEISALSDCDDFGDLDADIEAELNELDVLDIHHHPTMHAVYQLH